MLPGLNCAGMAGSLAYSTTYIGMADSASGVFAGSDFGPAHLSRRIFVAVRWTGNSTVLKTLTGATIGGVTATIHIQNGADASVGAFYGIAIISALVPAGTSGTISLSFSGAIVSCRIYWASAIGLVATTANATATDETSSGGTATVNATTTIAVPGTGLILAITGGLLAGGGSPDPTLTQPPATATNLFALYSRQTLNAGRSVNATLTGSSPSVAVVAVTWQEP